MGSLDVTQFVGLVQPSRAPQHMHEYDEVGVYVIEGVGEIHMGDIEERVGAPGLHLLPARSLPLPGEAQTTATLRVMGVFLTRRAARP